MTARPFETGTMTMATDAIAIIFIHVVFVTGSDLGRAVLVELGPVMTDFTDIPGGVQIIAPIVITHDTGSSVISGIGSNAGKDCRTCANRGGDIGSDAFDIASAHAMAGGTGKRGTPWSILGAQIVTIVHQRTDFGCCRL
jgi:hypothetical protein